MWQFWDSGGVKLESQCNFSIAGCQWTVNCLLGAFFWPLPWSCNGRKMPLLRAFPWEPSIYSKVFPDSFNGHSIPEKCHYSGGVVNKKGVGKWKCNSPNCISNTPTFYILQMNFLSNFFLESITPKTNVLGVIDCTKFDRESSSEGRKMLGCLKCKYENCIFIFRRLSCSTLHQRWTQSDAYTLNRESLTYFVRTKPRGSVVITKPLALQ